MKTPVPGALHHLLLILLVTLGTAVLADKTAQVQEGEASYYANSLHGKKTTSGVPYDKDAMTAAHRKLPLGTRVKVTYLKTGQSVVVEINDRGPFAKGRLIDLSGAAARKLGMIEDGHGKVKLEIITP